MEDLNLVLRSYDVEPIYGLGAVRTDGGNVNILTTISLGICCRMSAHVLIDKDDQHCLDEIAKKVLPNCPMKTDIALHWLAVNGIQPSIPENPSTAPAETEENPSSLPHEMQVLSSNLYLERKS